METDVRGDWLIDRAIGYPWTWVTDKKYPQQSSYHIVSIVDISARGGIMLLSLTPKGDGSIPDEEKKIMREIGDWLKVNGEGIYGTRPWKTVAEGTDVDQIRSEGFNERRGKVGASWDFKMLEGSQGEAIRFTRSKDFKNLYAFVIGLPDDRRVNINTLRTGNVAKGGKGIKTVTMLGSEEEINWEQTEQGLILVFPEELPSGVAYGFKIIPKGGLIDDSPRELLEDPIDRKGDWPVFNSTR